MLSGDEFALELLSVTQFKVSLKNKSPSDSDWHFSGSNASGRTGKMRISCYGGKSIAACSVSEKGIGRFFRLDICLRAVAGEYACIGWQGEEFIPDTAQQELHIAIRQVSPANAPGKQGIAAE